MSDGCDIVFSCCYIADGLLCDPRRVLLVLGASRKMSRKSCRRCDDHHEDVFCTRKVLWEPSALSSSSIHVELELAKLSCAQWCQRCVLWRRGWWTSSWFVLVARVGGWSVSAQLCKQVSNLKSQI